MSDQQNSPAHNLAQSQEILRKAKWDDFGMSVFLVVMGTGILLAAWMLVQQAARNQVIREFATAAREGNMYVLSANTDWDSVRDGLKRDLKERAASSDTLPRDEAALDELVDYYVRPQNLPSLLYYYNANAAHINPADFVRDVSLSGITQFTVEIGAPPQFDKPWLNNLEPVRATFALDGLNWKLKQIHAPDYLIPASAPTAHFMTKAGTRS
ncbi:MAG: hypothetical protein JWM96_517 [Alphaproteobacteria bacterium]|nr:hypothetical protein [Alphaproteobacteria bacterium]